MRLFRCTCTARPVLYFENVNCTACGRLTGFAEGSMRLEPFVQSTDNASDAAHPMSDPAPVWVNDAGERYRQCANWFEHGACNWMLPVDEPTNDADGEPAGLCRACSLNDMVPDLTVPSNIDPWRRLEVAKRRCVFTLLELGLPVGDVAHHPGLRDVSDVPELAFRFLADADSAQHFEAPLEGEERVLTGHVNGLITINLAEADDVARTRMRVAMEERYRTLLGHFRHETGHYYWDVFRLAMPQFVPRFRREFGDERADYAAALERHHAGESNRDWQAEYVSAYASMHPWEDWAETWAHYLHIIDTLETQQAFGTISRSVSAEVREVQLPLDLHTGTSWQSADFDDIFALWVDVSIVLNSLNRSMGLADPYPFVLGAAVQRKLAAVHQCIEAFATGASAG